MILAFHIVSGLFWLFNGSISAFLFIHLKDNTPSPYKMLCIWLVIATFLRLIWACNIPESSHSFLIPMIADTLLHASQTILLSIVTYLVFKIRHMMFQCINYDTFDAMTSVYPNAFTTLIVITSSLLVGFFSDKTWVFRGITYFTMITHAWVLVFMSASIVYRWRQALDQEDQLRQSFQRLIGFAIIGAFVCCACTVMIILNMVDHSFQHHYVFPITIFSGEIIIISMINYQSYRIYKLELEQCYLEP